MATPPRVQHKRRALDGGASEIMAGDAAPPPSTSKPQGGEGCEQRTVPCNSQRQIERCSHRTEEKGEAELENALEDEQEVQQRPYSPPLTRQRASRRGGASSPLRRCLFNFRGSTEKTADQRAGNEEPHIPGKPSNFLMCRMFRRSCAMFDLLVSWNV